MRRVRYLFLVAFSLVLLASCTDLRPGTPSPVVESTGTASATPPSGTSDSSIGAFGELKACDVLNRALNGQDFPPGEPSTIGSGNGCQSPKSGLFVALDLDDKQGIEDLRAPDSKKFDAKVNGRVAIQLKDAMNVGNGCQLAMKVATKARAMVTVSTGGAKTVDETCEIAGTIAVAVEPQLPKVS